MKISFLDSRDLGCPVSCCTLLSVQSLKFQSIAMNLRFSPWQCVVGGSIPCHHDLLRKNTPATANHYHHRRRCRHHRHHHRRSIQSFCPLRTTHRGVSMGPGRGVPPRATRRSLTGKHRTRRKFALESLPRRHRGCISERRTRRCTRCTPISLDRRRRRVRADRSERWPPGCGSATTGGSSPWPFEGRSSWTGSRRPKPSQSKYNGVEPSTVD